MTSRSASTRWLGTNPLVLSSNSATCQVLKILFRSSSLEAAVDVSDDVSDLSYASVALARRISMSKLQINPRVIKHEEICSVLSRNYF